MRCSGYAVIGLGLLSAVSLPVGDAKSGETALYTFTAAGKDGGEPMGRLYRDTSGNLYGTANAGGANNYGVVFKLTPGGKESVLYSFKSGSDGANPQAGVIADQDGNFYGTTASGGANGPHGTVFKLTPGGKETVLYSFTGASDGGTPTAPLVRDDAGNLYGTASTGGAGIDGGVVFKVTPKGKETVLHAFQGGNDGTHPHAGLYRDANGNLFGTAYDGGADYGGVVYEIPAKGKEKLLYTFTYGNDGGAPDAGLIRDGTGNFYGTTYYAGANGNGVVFKRTPKRKESVLYAFTGGNGQGDGAYPASALVRDTAGNLYGTTVLGGSDSNGVLFRVSPKGKEKVLYAFRGDSQGVALPGDLIMDGQGNLYGVTSGGGKNNTGTVFEFTP